MRINELVGKLRSAAQPMDLAPLYDVARRVSTRASMLALGESDFVVQRTASGVRITATNPSVRAKRALARAVAENRAGILTTVALQARDRLVS